MPYREEIYYDPQRISGGGPAARRQAARQEGLYQPSRWPKYLGGMLVLSTIAFGGYSYYRYQNADNCNAASEELPEMLRCAWFNEAPFAGPPAVAAEPQLEVQTQVQAPSVQQQTPQVQNEVVAAPSHSPELRNIAGFNGYTIPCEGSPRSVVRLGGNSQPRADWSGIPDSGTIGEGSAGDPIKIYIREACDTSNVRTLVVIASIHGSENGGQFVGHELLFNEDIPDNWRIVVVPELNKFAIEQWQRKNARAVDLNKNAPIGWESTMSGRPDPNNNNYRGPSPASEPETQTLMKLLTSLGQVDLALYYHDKLGYIAPVGSTSMNIADHYAAQVGYPVGKEGARNSPVTVDGALDTWHNRTTGSPALLVEMTNDQSDPVINQHVNAVLSVLNAIG